MSRFAPLKADDNWARQTREKSTSFLSERGNSLVDKVPLAVSTSVLELKSGWLIFPIIGAYNASISVTVVIPALIGSASHHATERGPSEGEAYTMRSRTMGSTSLASRSRCLVASPPGHTFKKVKP